jgi:hypothetical protein
MSTKKAERKRAAIHTSLESFFMEIEHKYDVSREDVLRAVDELGAVKGRIRTYFLVESYMRKKKALVY